MGSSSHSWTFRAESEILYAFLSVSCIGTVTRWNNSKKMLLSHLLLEMVQGRGGYGLYSSPGPVMAKLCAFAQVVQPL